MTYKEIMERFEALEPYVFETAPAIVMELETAREIHDLIVRQNAEVERLKKILDDKCDRCVERTYNGTINEFVERLKDSLCVMVDYCDEDQLVVQWDDICELVKELTEGNNGTV